MPPTVETAADLAERLGRSEDWIVSRTGVKERRVAHESMAEMGAHAVRDLLDMGDGAPGARPDLLINASLTPMQLIPDSSIFLQRELGWEGTPSFSIHATCLSFLVGLQAAGSLVQGGAYRRIVLVSSEQGSISRDFSEPESAALIGDGAAAALIEPALEGEGFLGFAMKTWPEGYDYAEIKGCGTRLPPHGPETLPEHNLFRMRGTRIWRLALTHADEILDTAFAQAGMKRDDVDVIIPHQASGPMLELFPKFGFSAHKVVNVIDKFGNCIAASIPMALHTAVASGRLERGQTALIWGTGAGLSMTAAVLRY